MNKQSEVLNQYDAHINFNDKTIQWTIRGEQRTTPFSENIPGTNQEKNQITNINIPSLKSNKYKSESTGI